MNQNRIRALERELEDKNLSEQERANLRSKIGFLKGEKKNTSHQMSAEAVSEGLAFKGGVTLNLLIDNKYLFKKDISTKKGPSTLNATRGSQMAPFFNVSSSGSAVVCNNFESLILVSASFNGRRYWTMLTPESVIRITLFGDIPPTEGWAEMKKVYFKAYNNNGRFGTSIDQPSKCVTQLEHAPYDMRSVWEAASTFRSPTHLYPVKHMPTQDDAMIYYKAPASNEDEEEEHADEPKAGTPKVNNKAMNDALRIACEQMMSVNHPMYAQCAERSGILHPLHQLMGYQRITGEEVTQFEPQFQGQIATEGPAAAYGCPFLCNPTTLWVKNNKAKGWNEKTMPIPRCDFTQQINFSDPNQQDQDGESKVTNILLVNGTIWAEQLETLGVTNPKHVAAFFPDLIKSAAPFVRGDVDLTRTTGLCTNTESGAQWEGDVRCYGIAVKVYEIIVDWIQMLCSRFIEVSQLCAFKLLGRFLKNEMKVNVNEKGYVMSTERIPTDSADPIIKHVAFKMAHGTFPTITGGNIVNAFESKVSFELPQEEDGELDEYRFFLLTNAEFRNPKFEEELRALYYQFYLDRTCTDKEALREKVKAMAFDVSKKFMNALDAGGNDFVIPENHQYTIFQVRRAYIDTSGCLERDFGFLGSRPTQPPEADKSKAADQQRKRLLDAARKPSEVLQALGLLTDQQRQNIDNEAFLNDVSNERKASSSSSLTVVPDTYQVPAGLQLPVEEEYDDNPYAGMNIPFGGSSVASSSTNADDEAQIEGLEDDAAVEDIDDDTEDEQPKPDVKPKKKKKTDVKAQPASKGKGKRKREAEPSSKSSTKKQK